MWEGELEIAQDNLLGFRYPNLKTHTTHKANNDIANYSGREKD